MDDRAAKTVGVRRHTVNRRLLLITVGLLVVLVPASYVWYRYQLKRTADALLARAEQLMQQESVADKNLADAVSNYQRYLAIFPEDDQALVKLVEAYNQFANVGSEPNPNRINRLNSLLYQAVGRLPENNGLRRMLAENLLTLGDFTDAATAAQELLANSPTTGDARAARRVKAISHYLALSLGLADPAKRRDSRSGRPRRYQGFAGGSRRIVDRYRLGGGRGRGTPRKRRGGSRHDRGLAEDAAASPTDSEFVAFTTNALRSDPGTTPAMLADHMMDQLVDKYGRGAAGQRDRGRFIRHGGKCGGEARPLPIPLALCLARSRE